MPGNHTFNLQPTSTNSAWNWTLNRCRFLYANGTANSVFNIVPFNTGAGADYDLSFNVTNCFFSGHCQNVFNLASPAPGYGGHVAGGVLVKNATIFGGGTFVNSANWSTILPAKIYNSIYFGQQFCNAGASSQITEDYNHYIATTANVNVTGGGNSQNGGTGWAVLLESGNELVVGKLLRPFGTPYIDSPDLGFGGNAPLTIDALNRQRPSGGAVTWSTSNVAIGCYERHDFGIKDTVTFDVGPSSMKMTGPGDQLIQVPVSASSTTISVKVQWDTNYGAGTKPQLQALAANEIGVSTQTVTATGSSGAFNTITLAGFTPTAKGWVNVLLISNAAATGVVNWDTFNVA